MPLYEYKCCECGFEFEEVRKMSDRMDVRCPECNHGVCTLLISKTNTEQVYPFYHEHLDPNGPVLVKSKEHFRQLCLKYGKYSKAIDVDFKVRGNMTNEERKEYYEEERRRHENVEVIYGND